MANLKDIVAATAEQLTEMFPEWDPPAVLVQFGTGFSTDHLFDSETAAVPLASLAGMPEQSPAGIPEPRLRLGRCNDRQILVMEGHSYIHEPGGVNPCILPILAASAAGIPNIVLVEAGLSLREDIKPGSWMALTDYIGNQGVVPLAECADLVPNVFADMTHAFSQVLNAELINAAANVGIFPRLGVYQGNLGPQFSTPAEVHAARRNGADILGHAVIPETIVGTAAGCRVSALVLVAETAPSYRGKRVTHQDVTDAIEFCSPELMRGLRRAFRHGELFAAPAEQNQPAETSGIDLRLGLF